MGVPGKKRYQTGAQMRRVNWSKVAPRELRGTVWEDADEEQWEDCVPFDLLESVFAAAQKLTIGVVHASGLSCAYVFNAKCIYKRVHLLVLQRSGSI